MDDFAKAIIDYHRDQGRKQLPWQQPRTPYRVWVSEVMLQQTQVERVIAYFNRFMHLFPSIAALAEATSDQVMSAWSGLGYYARARNLHEAAKLMVLRHKAEVPQDFSALLALPGIGRSTAGAIRASAFGIRAAILDGNVKRVLSRFHAIRGAPGKSATEKALWQLAELHTPDEHLEAYTQGIMDFGALQCLKVRPRCDGCALSWGCAALAQGAVEEIPMPRKRARRPLRRAYFLLLTDRAGRLYIERRADNGLWGGLWCMPMRSFDEGCEDFTSGQPCAVSALPAPAAFTHQFTHFALEIHPVRLTVDRYAERQEDSARWVAQKDCQALGMPAPARRLIEEVFSASTTR